MWQVINTRKMGTSMENARTLLLIGWFMEEVDENVPSKNQLAGTLLSQCRHKFRNLTFTATVVNVANRRITLVI